MIPTLQQELLRLQEQVRDGFMKIEQIKMTLASYGVSVEDSEELPRGSSLKINIPYTREARKFIEQWPRDRGFTISDFCRFLANHYSKDAIHPPSMRAPFPRLIRDGVIYVSLQGSGTSPNRYRITIPGEKKIVRYSDLGSYRPDAYQVRVEKKLSEKPAD